ncbi:MAG: preprotein translocase subunit SecG [Ruminococcaceae bacterium]|nr:preprotein translocase subunit SecG [Oscillospiraceae bacterium]
MTLAIQIAHLVVCIALVVVVIFQSGKKAGLSGAISGAADTFLAKNKSKGADAILAKATKWVALAFAVLTLCLHII